MAWKRNYTKFTAAEAEAISGIGVDRQRDLRRHGYLPALEGGHARFDVSGLAIMTAAAALSEVGIPPSVSWPLAKSCGTLITMRLLNARRGVADPQGLLNEDLIKSTADAKDIRWAVASAQGDKVTWVRSAEELVGHLNAVSVILDLDLLADRLADRTKKVFVTIEPQA
jgi:hypothetical protein